MKMHRFDWVSFLFGGLFLIAGALLVTDTRIGVRLDWAIPAAIVLIGLVLLIAAIPRRSRTEPEPTPDDP